MDKETFYNSKFNLVDYYELEEKKLCKMYVWSKNIKVYVLKSNKFLLYSNCQLAENRHVMCVAEKAGFEPRTLGTGAKPPKRATNCATAPV